MPRPWSLRPSRRGPSPCRLGQQSIWRPIRSWRWPCERTSPSRPPTGRRPALPPENRAHRRQVRPLTQPWPERSRGGLRRCAPQALSSGASGPAPRTSAEPQRRRRAERRTVCCCAPRGCGRHPSAGPEPCEPGPCARSARVPRPWTPDCRVRPRESAVSRASRPPRAGLSSARRARSWGAQESPR